MFLMRAFTCSLQVVCYIFVASKFWKILVVVQPFCLSLGNVDASVTNTIPADPLLTLDESHWLELMDPGVPVLSQWPFGCQLLLGAHAMEGRMGTTPVPKAWDGCNEILLGVGMTTNTVTHCCEQLDVAYSWDCCEMLQFFPLLLPFQFPCPFFHIPFPLE